MNKIMQMFSMKRKIQTASKYMYSTCINPLDIADIQPVLPNILIEVLRV